MAQRIAEVISLSDWLAPEIIVPALGVVLASVIVPILLHFLKGLRERQDKILEIRTNVYTDYFRKFEEAAMQVGTDYERFSKVTLRNAFRDLLEANSSPDAIVKFQDEVGRIPYQIQEAHRKATEEITTLKILGSDNLFRLTSEFELLNKEILEMSSAWLHEMQQGLYVPDFETPIANEMKVKGQQVVSLKNEIIKQMRTELNIGK